MADQIRNRRQPLTVIYITSRGHSGSTLLTQLISSHSQVISAGELKMLNNPDPKRKLCSCHKLAPNECPFWSNVGQRLIASTGKSLDQLQLLTGNPAEFHADNLALFEAIAAESGLSFIVDSSKSLNRLELLLDTAGRYSGFQVRPIHLHRGPLGSLNSARKKGENIRASAYNYVRMFFLTAELMRSVNGIRVYYEQLASQPEQQLRSVMRFLQLPFEPEQLRWRAGERRDIHGNEMRFGSSDQIRLDTSWRRDLSLRQKLAITTWTLPVRLRSRWLFSRMKTWIKSGIPAASA